VLVLRFVKQLMAWRICGQADLLAQAALCVALVNVFCDGRAAYASYDRRAKVLAGLGLGALLLGSAATGSWNATLLVLSLLAAAVIVAQALPLGLRSSTQGGLTLSRVTGALLVTLVAVNVARFTRLGRYSNVLSGGDQSVSELCAWAQAHTAENALFLTPPHEDEIRFSCRRAVVVDWKSPPAVPSEVLEWYERIEAVSGRKPVRGDADLLGYEQLDAARVASLRRRYGIDYAIVERGHELDLGGKPAYAGQRFVVYAVSGGADVVR
jgi:hypothetical protein